MDLLRKSYKKHGEGGFSKVRFWHVKYNGAWQKTKRVLQKINEKWELVHSPEGSLEIEITLTISAGTHYAVSLKQLAAEQTTYSDDLLSIYPFSITLNVEELAFVLGRRDGLDSYSAALSIGGFGEGTSVTINNHGTIAGIGGKGGDSYSPHRAFNETVGPFDWGELHSVYGENGGNAIGIEGTLVTIHNYGRILGGGGGGAGGLPIVRAYMNYIEQAGGPFVGFSGPVSVGGLNGEATREAWMVIDFGNNGAGGGGAPYGEAGDFDAGTEFSSSEIPIEKIANDRKRIAIALDQSVLSPKCFENEKVQKFIIDGLLTDSIGSSTYYPESSSGPSTPETDDKYAGILTTLDENLTNYSWKVNGTWFGPYWLGIHAGKKDHVTKTIEARGPSVFSYNSRNLNLTETAADNGSFEGGGNGGSVAFSTEMPLPSSTDFKGNYQGGDDCTILVNDGMSAAGATDSSIFGSYSNGTAGGGYGTAGSRNNYPGYVISSPYGGELMDLPAISIGEHEGRGGYAGRALDPDGSSSVSYNGHGDRQEIKGLDYP